MFFISYRYISLCVKIVTTFLLILVFRRPSRFFFHVFNYVCVSYYIKKHKTPMKKNMKKCKRQLCNDN
jgi:hypothetical protein